MITQYTSPLIPAAVVDGRFPTADEDKLAGLAAHWTAIGTELSGDSDSITALSRTVFANWSGSGADAASSQITQVSRFATSVSGATGVISTGCSKAASYVTNTKNGINVVLIQLDNLTKAQILIGMANPLVVPACLLRIIELRKQARALIAAYYEALTSAMGSISFSVTIAPRPKRAGGTTSATSRTTQGGTGSTGATTASDAAFTTPIGGTRPSGGGPASHGSLSAPTDSNAWTGGLADYKDIGDAAAIIGMIPARRDSPTETGSTSDGGASTQGHQHTENAPGTQTAPGTQPTGPDAGITAPPTGTDALSTAHDLSGAFPTGGTNGQLPGATPPGQGGQQPGGGLHHDGGVSAGTKQDIVDTVAGRNPGQSVANTLTPNAGLHLGPPSQASVPPPAQPPSPADTLTQVTDVRHPAAAGGGAGPDAGWSGTTPTSTPAPAAAPAAASPQIPAGTGAAGAWPSGSTATQGAAPPPVMPIAGSSPLVTGPPAGTSLGPGIQIAPGTAMSTPMTSPVTSSGAFSGLTPAAPAPMGASAAAPAPLASNPVVPANASPPAPAPSTSSPPGGSQAGPTVTGSQPLRIETSPRGGSVPTESPSAADAGVVTVASAIVTLGLVGAAATHFAGLWEDLGTSSALRPVGAVLPTQFGSEDERLAAMPLGMETVYQKVLLPGEVDQLFAGQVETIRGLVYPYEAVRGLHTPAQLYDALGLGFAVASIAGSDTLAFNRDAESVDVLRCAGLRGEDLVTPVDADVNLPAGTMPAPLVRHHTRPWTGTGEAPGSTSDNVIEEHEILGYASVGIPHLAEIWRLHADGREEYVSTYNQRNSQWLGDTTPSPQLSGRRIDNGAYAILGDGTVFRTIVLSERHSVLIAHGVSAPEHFEQVHDGSYRLVVANSDIVGLMGVTTIGSWRGLPVQLLHRQGDMLLVDYAGDDPAAAAAGGFLQTNQGQWQPRWVEHAEVTDTQELERPYPPLRQAAESETSDTPVGARA